MECPYCQSPARLLPKGLNGRSLKPVWACSRYPVCDAWIDCRLGTQQPAGDLADQALRSLRHRLRDAIAQLVASYIPLHETEAEARAAARRWLSAQLGVDSIRIHPLRLAADDCARVIKAIASRPIS